MKAFRHILMGVALVGLLAAPATAGETNVAKGEAAFAAQKCSLCHSIDGQGNKKFPLDRVGQTVSADDLKLWLVDPRAAEAKTGKSGKPAMRSFAKLPAEEIDAIVAYLLTLR
jgi:mono/diheme cytochrome c family protein